MLGLVSEHGRASDVANGVEAGDIGAAEAINDDAALVGFDAEGLETKVFDIADNAHGGDDAVHGEFGFRGALLYRCGDAVGGFLQCTDFRTQHDLDSLLLSLLS